MMITCNHPLERGKQGLAMSNENALMVSFGADPFHLESCSSTCVAVSADLIRQLMTDSLSIECWCHKLLCPS
jgi:hypothetical protein